MRALTSTGAAPRGDGLALTWRYTYWSLWIYVAAANLGPASLLVRGEPDVPRAVVCGVLLVACLVIDERVMRSMREGLGRGHFDLGARLRLLAPGLGLVAVLSLDDPAPIGPLLVPWTIACLLTVGVPSRGRATWLVVSLGTIVAARVVPGLLTGATPSELFGLESGAQVAGAAVFAALLPALVVFQIWLWDLVLRVRDAGEAAAELATVRERLRFAADLHDVQGHHLQVIALKTELAERLIDRDPDAARVQVAEAQQIARQAISETRGLVQGYRATSLAEEAANAASVLEAAGATCRIDLDAAPDDTSLALLGSLLREATTNILRHSAAREVSIVLDRGEGAVRLTVTNDGAAPDGEAPGSGIASLSERFAAAGGAVSTHRTGDRFTLTGTVPPEAGGGR
jgi:two-component system sensor histidine kinase DesK